MLIPLFSFKSFDFFTIVGQLTLLNTSLETLDLFTRRDMRMALCLYLYVCIYSLSEGQDLNHGHSNNERNVSILVIALKADKMVSS